MLKLKNILLVLALFSLILCLSCKKDPATLENKNEPDSVTDIDGNVYQIVKIGDQWWMAENLKVTHYRNGEAILNITDNGEWSNLSTGAYCIRYNNSDNIDTYGLLYNWYAVDDSRNIAPTGWHVPSDEEFKILENYLIANGYNWDGTTTENKIGKSLASKTGWHSSPDVGDVGNEISTNNTSGFSALGGGYRLGSSGAFNDFIGFYGRWWSSTLSDSSEAFGAGLSYNSSIFEHKKYHDKRYGCSIRLVRD